MGSVIALLSDFGAESVYVGVMKAVILSINKKATLVDVSHTIAPHNIREASFLLAASYRFFPKKTIFVVVVDPGVGSQRTAIAIKTRNYYFIGPDNGLMMDAAGQDTIKEAVALSNRKYFLSPASNTFHGRDIFAPVAAYLSKGVPLGVFGAARKKIQSLAAPKVSLAPKVLTAAIVHIDRFGNLITNIEKREFFKFVGSGKFVAYIGSRKIISYHNTYSAAPLNTPFFIEGSFKKLEVSLKKRSAYSYFKPKVYQRVIVKKR